jgi:hypothetical protein
VLKVQLLAFVVVHVRRLHPECHFAQSALASFCESPREQLDPTR